MNRPELAAVVVAWRAATDARELAALWPRDGRSELVVVDQSGDVGALEGARVVTPGANVGFAAGSNLGARATDAPLLLFLNPDARPEPGAIDLLLAAFAEAPGAAGFVPRLVGFDGASQARWQLRRLPTPLSLLAHAFFVAPEAGATEEPRAGEAIEQPAAAALALRRDRFETLGGFDERFFPAWWEDVDLARRLADAGEKLLYAPGATFRHRLGSSVDSLGYRDFLVAYDRNLLAYLEKHHGRGWGALFRLAAIAGALARAALLPLRKPRRARSRGEAFGALLAVAAGAPGGWALARAAPSDATGVSA